MTTRLQVTFDRMEADALARLAAAEYRDPRDQVRFVVRRELERCGLLSPTDLSEAGQSERQPTGEARHE